MKHTRINIFLCIALFLGGCTSIDISKRRHLPGFHVELGKAKQHRQQESAKAEVAERSTMAPLESKTAAVPLPGEELAQPGIIHADVSAAPQPAPRNKLAQQADAFFLEPFRELKQEKAGRELRRSVFPEEGDEKYGWSTVAIISLGLGVVAFIMMFVAIFSAIGFGYLWFVPAIIGFFFGLAALITGVIGMKKTRRGGRKGRGFAIAGLVSGIVGMVVSLLVAVIAGVIRFIDDRNGFD